MLRAYQESRAVVACYSSFGPLLVSARIRPSSFFPSFCRKPSWIQRCKRLNAFEQSTSMLEAEKPFMFASSSTGRPATANDFNSAANATSAEVSVNTSNAGSSNASGLPRIVPPQQKPQTPQEGASQLTPTQPPPPPPPPPQPQSQGITTATSLPPDHRITLPPATVPPPTPYYHPHHHHHQHHQHQHHQLHQHPHHSASAVSAPPPPSVKEEEGYHYHQHPAHAPAAYGRQHPERDSAYTYRPATSSSGLLNVGAEAYTHPQQPQSQQQRRQQQQQPPPPPPPPHHQHTHHAPPPPPPPPHHHTGSPYHVHHLHQHIPQQQAHTQVVSEEQSYYGASGAATGVNVNGSTYLTEVDDSDAWFEGNMETHRKKTSSNSGLRQVNPTVRRRAEEQRKEKNILPA